MVVNLKPFANLNTLQASGVVNISSHWKNHVIADAGQTEVSRVKARAECQLSLHHWLISYDGFLGL